MILETVHSNAAKKALFNRRVLAKIFFPAFFSAGIATVLYSQPNRDCRQMPPHLKQSGLDLQSAAFSTSERKTMGLVALEYNLKTGAIVKSYQHPSWQKAGWLGPMVITEKGEVWVAPVPVINTNFNKTDEQNKLWKVDAQSGVMEAVISLPYPEIRLNNQNPYGLLGLSYDCDNGIIYASSVAGSTRDTERGKIYAIKGADKKVLDTLDGLDAFGLGVGVIDGVKKLYFGKARGGEIYAVPLAQDGRFEGLPALELSLDDLGPRGDDRARKIRFAPDGTMTVTGIEFYFNLTAPTEKQETVYQFKYEKAQKKWLLASIK